MLKLFVQKFKYELSYTYLYEKVNYEEEGNNIDNILNNWYNKAKNSDNKYNELNKNTLILNLIYHYFINKFFIK